MLRIKRSIKWYTSLLNKRNLNFWWFGTKSRNLKAKIRVFHTDLTCIPRIFEIYAQKLTKKSWWEFFHHFLQIAPLQLPDYNAFQQWYTEKLSKSLVQGVCTFYDVQIFQSIWLVTIQFDNSITTALCSIVVGLLFCTYL